MKIINKPAKITLYVGKFFKLDIYDKKGYVHLRLRLWPEFEFWIDEKKDWKGNYIWH